MKVRDMIQRLLQEDPDATVGVEVSNGMAPVLHQTWSEPVDVIETRGIGATSDVVMLLRFDVAQYILEPKDEG